MLTQQNGKSVQCCGAPERSLRGGERRMAETAAGPPMRRACARGVACGAIKAAAAADPEDMSFEIAQLVLRDALAHLSHEDATRLVCDLLDSNAAQCPHAADRLFRCVVLCERWDLSTASVIYCAARAALVWHGILCI